MTSSSLNSNVHARVNNRLTHRGLARIDNRAGDWNIVREEIARGGSPKEIATRAARIIARKREILAELADLAEARVAHDPIDDATRIFAGV